ncbi:hypothetical protein [Terasakiella sp.]|uniref:hypothetical protein n=1 Tax=Terasakiella sp. TaxID=2034861 RepID=UPI003AA911F7
MKNAAPQKGAAFFHANKKKTMPSKSPLILISLIFILSGCAAPPALQILSLALDGISYITTDKTLTDHGLSALTQKDCKLLRSLQDQEICQKENQEPQPETTQDQAKLAAAKPSEPTVQ